jgi:predicted small integral membrane protein
MRDLAKAEPAPRPSFLPFPTNTFDRVFVSVVVMVALHLFWMRFVEAYLPLEVVTAISLGVGYLIVRYG